MRSQKSAFCGKTLTGIESLSREYVRIGHFPAEHAAKPACKET